MTSILWTSLLALWAGLFQANSSPIPTDKTTKVVENDRMVVWDVSWSGKPLTIPKHDLDMAIVYLAPPAKVGSVLYINKGVSRQEDGPTDSARRAILVMLKDVKVPPLPLKSGLPPAFPRENGKKLQENDRVTFWEYEWRPGKPMPMHHHIRQAVAVFLSEGQLRSVTPEGMVELSDTALGTVRAAAPGRIHTEEAVKGSPRAVIVELK
jgi:hypothetical protein